MPLTLYDLNTASQAEFARLLDGCYEHSPWIAERTWAKRPFTSLAGLKRSLVEEVREAVLRSYSERGMVVTPRPMRSADRRDGCTASGGRCRCGA